MEDFIKDRNEAFASKNKEKIIAYCNKYKIAIPEKDDIFWAGVHKCVCDLFLKNNGISLESYEESYKWLTEHGYSPSIEKGDEE